MSTDNEVKKTVTATLESTEEPRFKPCPMCGKPLSTNDVHFLDCEGGILSDLERLEDCENAEREENVACMLGDDWRNYMSNEEYKECVEQFKQLLEEVEYIAIDCPCGFSFCRDSGSFPRTGWLKEFTFSANRRCA